MADRYSTLFGGGGQLFDPYAKISGGTYGPWEQVNESVWRRKRPDGTYETKVVEAPVPRPEGIIDRETGRPKPIPGGLEAVTPVEAPNRSPVEISRSAQTLFAATAGSANVGAARLPGQAGVLADRAFRKLRDKLDPESAEVRRDLYAQLFGGETQGAVARGFDLKAREEEIDILAPAAETAGRMEQQARERLADATQDLPTPLAVGLHQGATMGGLGLDASQYLGLGAGRYAPLDEAAQRTLARSGKASGISSGNPLGLDVHYYPSRRTAYLPTVWKTPEGLVSPRVPPERATMPVLLTGVEDPALRQAALERWGQIARRHPRLAAGVDEIVVQDLGISKAAHYDPKARKIVVDSSFVDDPEAWFHELTHAGQDARGHLPRRGPFGHGDIVRVEAPAMIRGRAYGKLPRQAVDAVDYAQLPDEELERRLLYINDLEEAEAARSAAAGMKGESLDAIRLRREGEILSKLSKERSWLRHRKSGISGPRAAEAARREQLAQAFRGDEAGLDLFEESTALADDVLERLAKDDSSTADAMRRAGSDDFVELAQQSLDLAPSPPAAGRRTVADFLDLDPASSPSRTLTALSGSGDEIGELRYTRHPGGGFTVDSVSTGERGSGVGRQLYREAYRREGPYRGSLAQTPEGEGFVARLRETDPEIFEGAPQAPRRPGGSVASEAGTPAVASPPFSGVYDDPMQAVLGPEVAREYRQLEETLRATTRERLAGKAGRLLPHEEERIVNRMYEIRESVTPEQWGFAVSGQGDIPPLPAGRVFAQEPQVTSSLDSYERLFPADNGGLLSVMDDLTPANDAGRSRPQLAPPGPEAQGGGVTGDGAPGTSTYPSGPFRDSKASPPFNPESGAVSAEPLVRGVRALQRNLLSAGPYKAAAGEFPPAPVRLPPARPEGGAQVRFFVDDATLKELERYRDWHWSPPEGGALRVRSDAGETAVVRLPDPSGVAPGWTPIDLRVTPGADDIGREFLARRPLRAGDFEVRDLRRQFVGETIPRRLEAARGSHALAMDELRGRVKRVERAAKAAKRRGEDVSGIWDRISQARHGEIPWESLPEAVREPARRMWDQLDELSDARVAEGIVDPEDALEAYTHRAYRAFDDPEWAMEVETDPAYRQVWDDALALVRRQVPDLADDEAVGVIQALVARYGPRKMAAAVGAPKAANRVLNKRTLQSPEIRRVMGEYTDARVVAEKTVKELSWDLEAYKFWRDIGDEGSALGVFRPAGSPTRDVIHRIGGGGEGEMASRFPSEDLLTREGLKRALVGSFEDVRSTWYSRLAGRVNLGKTVGSIATQARNFLGHPMTTIANGRTFWDVGRHRQVLRILARRDLPRRRQAVRLGILGQGATSNEVGDFIRMVDPSGPLSQGLAATGKAFKGAYAGSDDLWRTYNWLGETEDLMHARGLSRPEAEVLAADRVRDMVQTYDRAPKIAEKLRRAPFVGGLGATFYTETIRNVGNIARVSADDIAHGIGLLRAGDVVHGRRSIALGMRRYTGLATALISGAAVAEIQKRRHGISDEEEAAARRGLPRYDQNAELIFTGKDEAGLTAWDYSYANPYSVLARPLIATQRAIEEGRAPVDAVYELMSSLAGGDILATSAAEATFGREIQLWPPELGRPIDDRLAHLGRNIAPGTLNTAEQIASGRRGPEALLGVRTIRIDPEQGTRRQAGSLGAAYDRAASTFRRAGAKDPEKAVEKYLDTLDKLWKGSRRLGKDTTTLGLAPSEAQGQLYALPREVRGTLSGAIRNEAGESGSVARPEGWDVPPLPYFRPRDAKEAELYKLLVARWKERYGK